MKNFKKEKGKDILAKSKNKVFTTQQGITLIALVITIALNCLRSGRKLECVA